MVNSVVLTLVFCYRERKRGEAHMPEPFMGGWLYTDADRQPDPPPHANYEVVGRFGHNRPFWATVNGVRSRFEVREHMNIGKAWMCAEIDGRLPPGIYTESRMSNISAEP